MRERSAHEQREHAANLPEDAGAFCAGQPLAMGSTIVRRDLGVSGFAGWHGIFVSDAGTTTELVSGPCLLRIGETDYPILISHVADRLSRIGGAANRARFTERGASPLRP
jgi:hypothetical protein